VHLSVTQRAAVAAVAMGPGRWMLVDGTGRALAPISAVGPARVTISGLHPVAAGQTFGRGLAGPLELLSRIGPGLATRVGGIDVAADGSVSIQLRSGGVAELCQPVDLAAKVASLTTFFAHVDDRGLQTVDVCTPDSPTATHVASSP
jgi:hypothetical protein